MSLLHPAEEALVAALGACHNMHMQLPVLHQQDQEEFVHAIHAAQNIVMSRPVMRQVLVANAQARAAVNQPPAATA